MRTVAVPLGDTVEVAGARLWTHRSDAGAPAVVFLPGAGSVGLDHLLVHELVAKRTTSVLYDRGGTGWSTTVQIPRSLAAVVQESRALLATLGIRPPYLLVGHSLGGAYARRHAQLHPDEVAGLVLLDPLHERWNDYQDTPLSDSPPPEQLPSTFVETTMAQVDPIFDRLLAGFPAEVGEPLRAIHLDPDRLLTGVREGMNTTALVAELSGAPDPDVPTILLAATGIDEGQALFVPRDQLERQIQGQHRLYADYATASTDRELRLLAHSSHSSIPFDAPGEVARAVFDVLDRVRPR
jgi:pimeloyl-ACP methyl ester carboxylesterase